MLLHGLDLHSNNSTFRKCLIICWNWIPRVLRWTWLRRDTNDVGEETGDTLDRWECHKKPEHSWSRRSNSFLIWMVEIESPYEEQQLFLTATCQMLSMKCYLRNLWDQNMNGTFPDSKSSHWTRQNIRVGQVLTIEVYLISCSAVFIQELRGAKWELFSHMCFPLTVNHSYLMNWLGIKSIMASTLIEVLHRSLFPGEGVPPLLTDLISNSENYSNVTVAMFAIPEFEKYSVPCYGYKIFGLLSKISRCLEQPPLNSSSGARYVQCTLMKIHSPSSFRRTGAQAGALTWRHSSSYSLSTTPWFLLTVFPRAL